MRRCFKVRLTGYFPSEDLLRIRYPSSRLKFNTVYFETIISPEANFQTILNAVDNDKNPYLVV